MPFLTSVLDSIYSIGANFINSPLWQHVKAAGMPLGAFLTLLIGTGVIYLFIKNIQMDNRFKRTYDFMKPLDLPKEKFSKSWVILQKHIQAGDEASIKLAVIKADQLLGEALEKSGYEGQTVAEKLQKLTSAQLRNLEDIWHAHKVRNEIVHRSDYPINPTEAQTLIGVYEQAFRELGLLEDKQPQP